MDKNTQKRCKYHPLAINKIAEMYGYSERYIRQILKGDRTGLMAENVLRDYKRFVKEFDKATKNIVNNIVNQ